MGSVGASKSTGLGIAETKRILGDSFDVYSNTDFVDALSKAELEYNEDGEIKFKFAGKDKESGRLVLMDVAGYSKKDVLTDIRNNGYTVQRLYTTQVYNALIKHTDGESWELEDARKIDNALLKKGRK